MPYVNSIGLYLWLRQQLSSYFILFSCGMKGVEVG